MSEPYAGRTHYAATPAADDRLPPATALSSVGTSGARDRAGGLVGLVKGVTGAPCTRAGNSTDRANSHAESVDHIPAVTAILGGTANTPTTKPRDSSTDPVRALEATRPRCRFLCGNAPCAYLQVTGLVDPTLRHKNHAEVLVDGTEIVVRAVAMRKS